MQMTMRWFGPEEDKVSLEYIRQVPGVEGVVGALYDVAVGEVWPLEKIQRLVNQVHDAGLKMEVIESVNIHDDIKIGLPSRDRYIANYQQTIRNLARFGVKVICYNFMPVFDWMKTDMNYVLPDGSRTMAFEKKDIDKSLEEVVKEVLDNSNGFALPGWEPERLAKVQELFAQYKDVDDKTLRENLVYFLKAVIPVCEEVGVKMACHPDDPGWPIFGLPRITHDQAGFDRMVKLHDSPCNTLCLCTGSLGSNVQNDIPAMVRHFGEMNRIGCLHVRNIKHLGSDRRFRESSHLSSDGDLDMYEIMKAAYETCPDTYIRPDHGRMIWDEIGRPGYGLYDRALGIAYLNGLWEAIDKNAKRG